MICLNATCPFMRCCVHACSLSRATCVEVQLEMYWRNYGEKLRAKAILMTLHYLLSTDLTTLVLVHDVIYQTP